jgi:aspartate ammonia-lyase
MILLCQPWRREDCELTMAMRTEKDSLGEREVPAGAYYGIQTQRAVENFPISGATGCGAAARAAATGRSGAAAGGGAPIGASRGGGRGDAAGAASAAGAAHASGAGVASSFAGRASGIRPHPLLIRAMGMIKEAAAEANRELGLVDKKVAGAIIAASREVQNGNFDDQFVVDVYQAGAGVSFHMNANEVIANRAIELLGGKLGDYSVVHPNDHVNFGQSTNDVFPTAMRLAAVLLFDAVAQSLAQLEASFARKGKEFDHILKSGRTHMMDAVPVRLGQEFAAYATAMRRARVVLAQAQDLLREVGLGGSAVGTGVNTHPKYQKLAVTNLAHIAHQRLIPTDDLRYAMQSNLAMSVASSSLRNLALELIRISNDLRLLSSGPNTGLAEIGLKALQPGSSIMPGKVNPVLAELTAMVGFQAVGADIAVAMAVQAGQLELNVMMPAMAWNVLHAAEILKNTMRVLAENCVDAITANEARCRFYANATISLAAALNPYIGYAAAAEIAKESVKTGRTVTEIALERKLLDEKTMREILDPIRMTEPTAPIATAKPKKKAKK